MAEVSSLGGHPAPGLMLGQERKSRGQQPGVGKRGAGSEQGRACTPGSLQASLACEVLFISRTPSPETFLVCLRDKRAGRR